MAHTQSYARIFERKALEGDARFRECPPDGKPALAEVAILVLEKGVHEKHFMSFAGVLCEHVALTQITPSDVIAGVLAPCSSESCDTTTTPGVRAGFDALIIPGGWAPKYENELGKSGSGKVCRFVHNGGGYIGVCAGAFVAARTGWRGTDRDFAMLGVQPSREYPWGHGTAECSLTKEAAGILVPRPGDHITCAVRSQEPTVADSFCLYYQSGQTYGVPSDMRVNKELAIPIPACIPLLRTHTIKCPENTYKPECEYSAVAGEFGEGRIVAFGPHPEASSPPGHTMLLNALLWVLRREDAMVEWQKPPTKGSTGAKGDGRGSTSSERPAPPKGKGKSKGPDCPRPPAGRQKGSPPKSEDLSVVPPSEVDLRANTGDPNNVET